MIRYMDFSYSGYFNLLKNLKQFGYMQVSYDDYEKKDRCVIIRHDIDYSLEKAQIMSDFERDLGVKSTFFLLLTSDFYSVFSLKGQRVIDRILLNGHKIGLHFDELRYPNDTGNSDRIREHILKEAQLLSEATGKSVDFVSMHRPSKAIIDSNLYIPGIINTYSDIFFNGFKYVSDSRRRWREPIEQYIEVGSFDRLQILVHPFWYNDEEISMKETVESFIKSAVEERYDELNDNFTDLETILEKGEILM